MARFSPFDLDEYILERLPLNKRITLECELEEDDQLVNEVEKRKRVIGNIRQISRESLLQEFEDWDTNGYQEKKKEIDKKEKKEFSLPAFASYLIAAIIMLGVYLLTHNYDPSKNFSPDKAYEFYFEPVNARVIFSSRNDSDLSEERKAVISKYQDHDFEGAIMDMNAYLDENDDAIIQMISGISYLAVGQNETGEQRLIYAGNRDKKLLVYTNWFLALSYMKTGQMEESKEYLLRVTDLGGYYAGKARELFRMAGGTYLGDKEIEQF